MNTDLKTRDEKKSKGEIIRTIIIIKTAKTWVEKQGRTLTRLKCFPRIKDYVELFSREGSLWFFRSNSNVV